MVVLDFFGEQGHLLRLTAAAGSQPVLEGDGEWLDLSYTPYSARLGRPVAVDEDVEEWARALADAYSGSALRVEVRGDAIPQPPTTPAPASPASTRPSRRALTVAAMTVAVLAVVTWLVTSGANSPAPARQAGKAPAAQPQTTRVSLPSRRTTLGQVGTLRCAASQPSPPHVATGSQTPAQESAFLQAMEKAYLSSSCVAVRDTNYADHRLSGKWVQTFTFDFPDNYWFGRRPTGTIDVHTSGIVYDKLGCSGPVDGQAFAASVGPYVDAPPAGQRAFLSRTSAGYEERTVHSYTFMGVHHEEFSVLDMDRSLRPTSWVAWFKGSVPEAEDTFMYPSSVPEYAHSVERLCSKAQLASIGVR